MRSSIAIAAHNEGESLVKTVRSVIESATHLDYEIVVADDASFDGSVKDTVRRFPQVRVVRHEQRQGASPAKHLGARNARGEVLVFLDGHTKPETGAIKRLVEDVEWLGGQAVVTPAVPALDTRRWKNRESQVGHGYRLTLEKFDCGWLPLSEMKQVGERGRKFYESPALIGCALAVSRELYDDLWGFDSHMLAWGVEDLDFGLKCWLMGRRILHDADAVIGHRFRERFDNFDVPFERLIVNQLRMARKNFTQAVWSQWVERCRKRHAGRLAEHPEGLWARAWSLFEADLASADEERTYLLARRVRDEFWYAERFGLAWPKLQTTPRIGFAAAEEPEPSPSPSPSPSPPPPAVDLNIEGVAEDKEETVGGVVVRLADGNNAPRKKIILATTETAGNVTLTRNNAKVKVFKVAAGGDEIAFDGAENKFPVGELPKNLYVQGHEASGSMRDVTLTLTHDGGKFDKVKFTVIWVAISTTHSTGTASTDNAGRDVYKALRNPESFDLGFGMVGNDGSVGAGVNFVGMGNGSEFIGTVSPSDFVPTEFGGELRFNRNRVNGRLWGGTNGNQNDGHIDFPGGTDTSQPAIQDNDPQSGESGGKIYDLDAPGINPETATAAANFVWRSRQNFDAWAEFKIGSAWIRCSTKLGWFSRTSIKLTGSFQVHFVDSSTANTIKRDAAAWTVDEWAGGMVRIVSGTGMDQVRRITGNTANTVTVSRNWATNPLGDSVYRLSKPSSWTKLDNVANDNKNGDGTTNLSWNLE